MVIGLFFAVLELVRHHGVRVEQQELHGEIWILAALPGADDTIPGTDSDETAARPQIHDGGSARLGCTTPIDRGPRDCRLIGSWYNLKIIRGANGTRSVPTT